MKKLFLIVFITCSVYSAQAEILFTCPTVSEIKKGEFHDWLPLYIEREELASYKDVEQFKKYVKQFNVARWGRAYLENGHCFYLGSDPIVKKITFAEDAWRPQEGQNWIWSEPNSLAECYTQNPDDCKFIQ